MVEKQKGKGRQMEENKLCHTRTQKGLRHPG